MEGIGQDVVGSDIKEVIDVIDVIAPTARR